MHHPTNEPILASAVRTVGDPDALRLLSELVAIAPTNLEDPVHHRWEKPNYARAAERIVRAAREFGLTTRIYDPSADPDVPPSRTSTPRPNVIVDLDIGAPSRTLILAHYDVVPVPAEQLGRWRSPPHVLTGRSDGRLYGRGANDDLGSGVVASLIALKHLAARTDVPSNVRLLICCDEETGGSGGIEAIKDRDSRLSSGDPDRILVGEVALIPDGDHHATAASSGVAFLDATFPSPPPLRDAVAFGSALARLHDLARTWTSNYPSPDWPDHGAPAPVITGRATVTRFDLTAHEPAEGELHLESVHAETDASNQVAEAVSLVVGGTSAEIETALVRLQTYVRPPFSLRAGGSTAAPVPAGARLLQLVGKSTHGGYPHRGYNPVTATLSLLDRAITEGVLNGSRHVEATYGVDLRIIPEMPLHEAVDAALRQVAAWASDAHVPAQLTAPPDRCRGGYALPMDDPAIVKLERILRSTVETGGIFGEYGGTDASSLMGVTTPAGTPLPALVFGSMDRSSHIHEADESIDPRLWAGVIRTIERYVMEP
ncbi:MAG: M20/M25/M40 family metallo-hydrolase [Thermoplasmata archaeon]